jgi:hypothetical protein
MYSGDIGLRIRPWRSGRVAPTFEKAVTLYEAPLPSGGDPV